VAKTINTPDVRIAEALERIAKALELQNELLMAVTFKEGHLPIRSPAGGFSPRYLRVHGSTD